MDWNPPTGSKISVANDGADPTIVIPVRAGATRYLTGLFLLFWLGMWTLGFRDAGSKVLAGNAPVFLVLWLGAWVLGGVFAASMLFRTLRPSVPETLQLKRDGIAYDSGVGPPQFNWYRRYQTPRQSFNQIFPKRIRAEFDRKQLQSLRLRDTDDSNRLTIDFNAARLNLASNASEVEREWLARLLAQRYSLTQVSRDAPAGA